jgi:hypothetical protein
MSALVNYMALVKLAKEICCAADASSNPYAQ